MEKSKRKGHRESVFLLNFLKNKESKEDIVFRSENTSEYVIEIKFYMTIKLQYHPQKYFLRMILYARLVFFRNLIL